MRLFAPQVKIREYTNFAGVAYLETTSGIMLNTSLVTTGIAHLYDLSSATPHTEVYGSGTLESATFMYDTVQTDKYANHLPGGQGYNFLYILEASEYQMLGGRQYRLEFLASTGSYGTFAMVWNITIGEMYS